jgi:hypothetical protein
MIARLATGEIDDAEQKSSLREIETLPNFVRRHIKYADCLNTGFVTEKMAFPIAAYFLLRGIKSPALTPNKNRTYYEHNAFIGRSLWGGWLLGSRGM